MNISHICKDGKVKVFLDGELGHHEALEAIQRIREIADVHLPSELQLDLSELSFMDSSGIAVIMLTKRRCAEIDCRFEIESIPGHALRVLKAAGISNGEKLKV